MDKWECDVTSLSKQGFPYAQNRRRYPLDDFGEWDQINYELLR